MMVATARGFWRSEPLGQQGLEIAQLDPAIDRPPAGERDQQRVGPPDRSRGALGGVLDIAQPRFEHRHPLGRGGVVGG